MTNPDRLTAIEHWVRLRGGAAHTVSLRAAGYSPYDVAAAVGAGLLHRIRRSWVATPDCGDDIRKAAAVGGRVTCVSGAKARGLWVPPYADAHEPHVAVPRSRSRIDAGEVKLHWAVGPVPVPPTTVEDPIVNVLFHVARCLPRLAALPVWESALRTGKVRAAALVRIRWRSTAAAALASVASDLSDSGLETIFVDGMRVLGVVVQQQVWIEGHPVDALIGDRLIVQIDGFEFHRAADRRRDLHHDTQLVLLGYTVLRFDYQQILFDWPHVQTTILTAMAQGLHLAA